MRELLLLRRLQGRGVEIVRALFYLSAIWIVGNIDVHRLGRVCAPRVSIWLPLSAAGVAVYGTASLGYPGLGGVHRPGGAAAVLARAGQNARDQVAERTLQP